MIAEEAKRPDGIDAISIMTPNDSHHAYAAMALDAGLDVVEELRGEGEVALGGEGIGNGADVMIHAENFLNDDNRAFRLTGRVGLVVDVVTEGAVEERVEGEALVRQVAGHADAEVRQRVAKDLQAARALTDLAAKWAVGDRMPEEERHVPGRVRRNVPARASGWGSASAPRRIR